MVYRTIATLRTATVLPGPAPLATRAALPTAAYGTGPQQRIIRRKDTIRVAGCSPNGPRAFRPHPGGGHPMPGGMVGKVRRAGDPQCLVSPARYDDFGDPPLECLNDKNTIVFFIIKKR